jgi:hypothetical protein
MGGSLVGNNGEGPYYALAIDPGGTTGLCYCEIKPVEKLAIILPEQKKMTLKEVWDTLDDVEFMLDYVVYESFEYRKNSREGLDLTPVKIIGVIELAGEWYESGLRIFPQTAAMGLGYYNDRKLQEKKVYIPGMPHAMDATRHMLHWLQFRFGGQFGITEVTLGKREERPQ